MKWELFFLLESVGGLDALKNIIYWRKKNVLYCLAFVEMLWKKKSCNVLENTRGTGKQMFLKLYSFIFLDIQSSAGSGLQRFTCIHTYMNKAIYTFIHWHMEKKEKFTINNNIIFTSHLKWISPYNNTILTMFINQYT